MGRETAAAIRGIQPFKALDGRPLLPSNPRLTDVVPPGWFSGQVLDRTRNAFPATLSREWGEAAWTAPDLWLRNPMLAATRASAALSGVSPADLELQQRRTYRRLRQSVEERRTSLRPVPEPEPQAQEPDEPPTPTDAMLALGGTVTGWSVRLVVLAFLLLLIGLGNELGIIGSIPVP